MGQYTGSSGDDSIVASDSNDRIKAGDGDDLIYAGDGNDRIKAGDGDDLVYAGSGNDLVSGGDGDDTVLAGDGNDLVFGGDGDDLVDAGDGKNLVFLGDGDDTVLHTLTLDGGDKNIYLGGQGQDKLVLLFDEETAQDAGVLAEVAAIATWIESDCSWFTSGELGLVLQSFEQLELAAPVLAQDDSFTTGEDTAAVLDVLANDQDLLGDTQSLASNTDALRITGIANVSGPGEVDQAALAAALTIGVDGKTVSFDPSGLFDHLGLGDPSAIVTFDYTIEDDQGFSATATGTVEVTPVNDAPIAAPFVTIVDEDAAPVSLDLLAGQRDPDANDVLAAIGIFVTDGNGSTAAFHDDGHGTITIDPGQYDSLGGGEVAELTISYELSDGTSTTPNTGILTVEGVEDPIVIAGDTEGAVAEDGDLVDSGALTASDLDAGDNPSFTPQTGTAGIYGSFEIDANGNWTYILDNSLAQGLAGGQVETESFTVEATNADGETATQTVEIAVTGAEDPLVITGDTDGAVKEDGETSFFQVFEVDPETGFFRLVTRTVDEKVASGDLTASDLDDLDNPSFTPQSGTAGTYGSFEIDANGKWTYTLDNTLAQSLDDGQVVTESFTVEAMNADGETATTTIAIDVTGAEDPIIINADDNRGAVKEDGVVPDERVASGRLTVSDLDLLDAPSFTVQSGTAGNFGSFDIDAEGNWTYTLDNDLAQKLAGDLVALEFFTVEATSADGTAAFASVEIQVSGKEDPIVIAGDSEGAVQEDGAIVDGSAIVNPGGGVEVTPAVNEQVAIGSLAASDADAVDNPSFTPQTGTAGSYGSFEIDANGNWTYTLDNSLAQGLAGGQVATESFTVEATNADGEVGTQTIEIAVTGAEDPIVIAGDSEGAVKEDGEVNFFQVFEQDPETGIFVPVTKVVDEKVASGTLTASDLDDLDNPSFTPQSGSAGVYGTFEIDANGEWTYTLDNALGQSLDEGQVVTESFTVEAMTVDGEVATTTVTIDVAGAEDPIIINADDDSGAVKEDGSIPEERLASGRLTVSDVDLLDAPSFTVQSGTAGNFGSFDIDADGNWTYTLDNGLAQKLPGGLIAFEFFTVEATSADGTAAFASVEIQVSGTEDPIVISGDSEGVVEEDGALIPGSVTLNPDGSIEEIPAINEKAASGALSASDADGGDNPSFTPQTGTAGAYGSFDIDANGNWSYVLDNSLAQALAGGEVATESFTVEATNADGESATLTVEVQVMGAEDPIIITGDSDGAVSEDGGTVEVFVTIDFETGEGSTTTIFNEPADSGVLSASDADDGDNPSFNPQTGTAGSYGTFKIDANGNWTYTLDNSLAQGLAGDQVVTESFTVEATNADGESATETVVVEVTGREDPIVIAGDTAGAVEEDGVLVDSGALSAGDADDADTPSFTPQTATAGSYGSFDIDASGNWSYTLNNSLAQALAGGQVVTESFTVEATNADGEAATETVEIVVTGAEEPLVISGDTEGAVEEDGALIDSGVLMASGNALDNPSFTPQTTASTFGLFEIDTAGNWTYTLDNTVAQGLKGDQLVTESFTVEATNANGETQTETVDVVVRGSEDRPMAIGDTVGAVMEDGVLVDGGQLLADDADIADPAIFSQLPAQLDGTYGSLSFVGPTLPSFTQDWTYTLDNSLAQGLAGGQVETEVFSFFGVSGGELLPGLITVEVMGTEDPIIITGDTEGTVKEDGLFASSTVSFFNPETGGLETVETIQIDEKTAKGSLTASDADFLDDPSFTAQTGTLGDYGSFEIDSEGSWTYSLDNLLAQPLTLDEVVTESFLVEATNADGEIAFETIEIDVVGAFDEGEVGPDVVVQQPLPEPFVPLQEPDPYPDLI